MSTWAIVVAAGTGTRFGGPKQYEPLAGRPVVEWATHAASQACDGVVVVVPSEAAGRAHPGADVVVPGGATRSESVRAGLEKVPTDASIIVVHDGARPLAGVSLFEAVIAAVHSGAGGAVPGLRVHDTLKTVEGGVVTRTVAREDLVAVQTPQAFRASALRAAHRSSPGATDDAALVEDAGFTVTVVPGDRRNIKVTEPEDLELAERLARP